MGLPLPLHRVKGQDELKRSLCACACHPVGCAAPLSSSFSSPGNDLLGLSILPKVNIYLLRFGVLFSQVISSLMIHIHDVYGIF